MVPVLPVVLSVELVTWAVGLTTGSVTVASAVAEGWTSGLNWKSSVGLTSADWLLKSGLTPLVAAVLSLEPPKGQQMIIQIMRQTTAMPVRIHFF